MFSDEKSVKIQKAHNDMITGMSQLAPNIIATSSKDGLIKLWQLINSEDNELIVKSTEENCFDLVGEFSSPSKTPISCLDAVTLSTDTENGSSAELKASDTNEVMAPGGRKRKREPKKEGNLYDLVSQKLSTSGLIVAGDVAGGVYILRAKTLTSSSTIIR